MTEYIVNPEEEHLFYGRKYEELIRCKDCRWFYPNEKGDKGWCSFSEHGYPTADEYCSSAERKTDNG